MQDLEFDFPQSLQGRVVLVAGGSGGLGSALVALLAKDGARVVCAFKQDSDRAERLRAHLQKRYGTDIELVQGDMTDPETRRSWVDEADALGEGLYGLVCCGGNPGRVKFDQVTEADLHDSMRENYYAPILLARDAASRMQARRLSGAIVFYSSMQSVAPFESSVNYAGPKSALQHAARILAKQWGGPEGIRVNVVAPGVNRAGMALKSIESGKYDFFVDKGIVPRFGRPEDSARAARLLLEPDNYITGQILTVDGGLTLRRDQG